jgi:hypothetical protein
MTIIHPIDEKPGLSMTQKAAATTVVVAAAF